MHLKWLYCHITGITWRLDKKECNFILCIEPVINESGIGEPLSMALNGVDRDKISG